MGLRSPRWATCDSQERERGYGIYRLLIIQPYYRRDNDEYDTTYCYNGIQTFFPSVRLQQIDFFDERLRQIYGSNQQEYCHQPSNAKCYADIIQNDECSRQYHSAYTVCLHRYLRYHDLYNERYWIYLFLLQDEINVKYVLDISCSYDNQGNLRQMWQRSHPEV